MNRNFGVGILIFCFGFSNMNLGWATQVVEVPPVIVQPDDLRDSNEQMLAQDRINRDQEFEITQLIEENEKLASAALAIQQDPTLEKIKQTMINYRDSLVSRDRARIMTNSQRASKYYDLIALTEDVDNMKDVGPTLRLKMDVIEGKHAILNELEEELKALNEELKSRGVRDSRFRGNDTIEIPAKTDDRQEGKIQMLTQRLGEMDQRIDRYNEIIAEKDQQIAQLKSNLDLLKSELEDKITQENNQGPKEQAIKPQAIKQQIVKQQENQIALLQGESRVLASNEVIIRSQAEQMAKAAEQFKDQGAAYAEIKNSYAGIKNEAMALRDKVNSLSMDLKSKDESIRWLNQVLATTKHKAEYYQLTSQQDQATMSQFQKEVQTIKDGFAEHFKDYDQFEKAIVSLKNQVSLLNTHLSWKQEQVGLLKSELENKNAQEKDQGMQEALVEKYLKAQLQDKENQIVKMKADIRAILDDRAQKEIYLHNAALQLDDRVKLAKQLIDLQQQETALLDEKNDLETTQNAKFDQRFLTLESEIKGLLVNHQMKTADLENQMATLKNELDQKQAQADMLEAELKDKIAEEKDQGVLEVQIQDLKAQLQDKDDQIAAMKQEIQAGQKTQEELDSLKQQMMAQQDKADLLKQQLDDKTAQLDQTALMMGEYQKKLEAKGNAYNEELTRALSARNGQAQLEAQIVDLNNRLQQKEAQIVELKKDMYDLQESVSAKDREAQANDLNLSMIQQKMVEKKINEFQEKISRLQATNVRQVQEITELRTELALVHKKLVERLPNIDEIDFLRTGFKNATLQLKQKDVLLAQIRANANEYKRKFQEQSREFQSLKDQLQDAQDEIGRRNEDLKYKNMEIIRLKSLSKLNPHEYKIEDLQAQLMKANEEIKFLHVQLNQFILPTKNNPLEEKLKQALDKIDEQGRVINTLVQKLQDCGQNVNLTKDSN